MVLRDPALRRLRGHGVPAWWRDARLGIFVHWTIASVPAYAPVGTEFSTLAQSNRHDAYAETPYVEWYENSLRFPSSSVARHHRATYGDRPYASFPRRVGGGARAVGPRRLGGEVQGRRRPPRGVRGQARRRLLPLADRDAEPTAAGLGLSFATS